MGESSELLERSDQLSELEAVLGGALSGHGRLVFVGGEAGAGKTVLLRHFCDQCSGSVRVLWGACDGLLTPGPLGPLFEIADTTGGELDELVRGASRPHEIAAALADELARRPTALVLEDMHWADEATLDVVRLIARRVSALRAVLVASYRNDELDRTHPLRVLFGELAPERAVVRLEVPPLSEDAVAKLAEGHGIDGEELYRKTNGNPFFVSEVLAGGAGEAPDTVRDAVIARSARLSEPARRLIEAASVLQPSAEVGLLEVLAPDTVDRIEECLASGMLVPLPDGVAFRHELARLIVEQALAPDRRIELHREAVKALAAAPGTPDPARLAHHAEGAADADAVLRFAPQAASAASSLSAHREAAAQWRRALRFAGDLPADEQARIREQLAYECYLTGELDDAIAVQEQALALRRAIDDPVAEGECLRSLSRLYRFIGRTAEAAETAREAVGRLEELPPGHELAMAYVNLGHLHTVAEAAEEALEWSARGAELAERLGDQEASVYALTNEGAVEVLTETAKAPGKLERSLDLALRFDLEENAGRAYLNLVWWPIRQRRYDLVDRYLKDGLDYCTEHGMDLWRTFFVPCQARRDLDRGRWDEAVDAAAEALRDHRTFAVPRVYALSVLGVVRARRGDPDVWPPLDEAIAMALPSAELQRIGPAAAARAEAAWLQGDREAVARATDAALELAVSRRAAWPLGELAYWRKRAGIEEEVPGAAEPYRPRSPATGHAPRSSGTSSAALTRLRSRGAKPMTRPLCVGLWTSCSDWAPGPRRQSSHGSCGGVVPADCLAVRARPPRRTPPA